MEFLASLQQTPLSVLIQESDWAHPIMLVFHAIGMAIVVGVVLMMDVRVLGFAKSLPLAAMERMLPLAWAGFVINAVSGLVIFMANGPRLVANWTFQLKIALIAAGGLSLWLMWRRLRDETGAVRPGQPGGKEKLIAAVSIVFWLGALAAGRAIAYTLSPY